MISSSSTSSCAGSLASFFDDFLSSKSPVPWPCEAEIGRGRPGPGYRISRASSSLSGLSSLFTVSSTGLPLLRSTRATSISSGVAPGTTVDEENHDVSLVRAGKRLFANGFLECVFITSSRYRRYR